MITAVRNFAKRNLFLRKLVGYYLASSGLFDGFFKNYSVTPLWEERISNVLESPDNVLIPKVENAGMIKGGKQIMHNGLKIYLGSYYGPEYSKMLSLSKGVHEPQEERVFMEALKTVPVGSLMIEMGAFWSFYSMWFNKEVKDAVNYMIEPDYFNMGQGKRNFKLNNMKGKFIQGYVGQESRMADGNTIISVDGFIKEHSIPFIHMLHSDIQGFEYEMLLGALNTFNENKIGYIFISTHSNELHYKCLNFLKERNFLIIASADLDETFSVDGLIVASAKGFKSISPVNISKKIRKVAFNV